MSPCRASTMSAGNAAASSAASVRVSSADSVVMPARSLAQMLIAVQGRPVHITRRNLVREGTEVLQRQTKTPRPAPQEFRRIGVAANDEEQLVVFTVDQSVFPIRAPGGFRGSQRGAADRNAFRRDGSHEP